MPELPEVETVRSGLSKHFQGRSISSVVLKRENLRFPFPPNMAEVLQGRKFVEVQRRAKYLLIRLSGRLTLMVHLGMSGYFSLLGPGEEKKSMHAYSEGELIGNGKHDHVTICLDDGSRVVYTDPRRFGMMDIVKTIDENSHRLLKHLGPEPLGNEWNAETLCNSLRERRINMKTALLNQKIVVGIGNIYACEALFRAKISPERIASSISTKRAELLVSSIKEILNAAIDSGGSTLNDFQAVDGELGYFTHFFQVYDREGEECTSDDCKSTIKRIVQGGRSTFYCKNCQK